MQTGPNATAFQVTLTKAKASKKHWQRTEPTGTFLSAPIPATVPESQAAPDGRKRADSLDPI